jgi:beta-N-acetylhexosaminidase
MLSTITAVTLAVVLASCAPMRGEESQPTQAQREAAQEEREVEQARREAEQARQAAEQAQLALRQRQLAQVQLQLDSMTLRQKVAQMVMPWIPGGVIPAAEMQRIERQVTELQVGGFIIGRGETAGSAATLARLQSLSRSPLLIGSDLERGPGMRLTGSIQYPAAMAIGATWDTTLAWRVGHATAVEGRASGINMAFAPVADVNINPANPIINTRAFGSDPEQVAIMSSAMARGLRDGGMIAVAKHFPGHGDTHTDSHLELPVIDAPRSRLDSVELVPFRRAIREDVGAIMTAHIAIPSLSGDQSPATLSPAIMTRLLRDELGYDGLLITDAMNMAGVVKTGDGATINRRAVVAGVDILLQPVRPEEAVDAVIAAVESGELSVARIDASVRRILLAKAQIGLLDTGWVAPQQPTSQETEALAEEIARRSITLVRDSGDRIPLAGGAHNAVHIVYTDRADGSAGGTFERTLRDAGWTVETIRLSRASTAAQIASAERAASRSDRTVVVSSYTQAVPWSGTTGLAAGVEGLVARVTAVRPVVYVSFGDPYLIRSFPSVSAYLLAWSDAAVSQRAAARAILGSAAIEGRLPIEVPPAYPLGFGLTRGARTGG